jgi:Carboxypeptidase regulatory-like domain
MQVFANHVCRVKFAAAVLFAAGVVFSAAPCARAQEVAVAEVDGRVADPTGASVAGATVRMTDVDTRQVHTYSTDAGGVFRCPNLPVGSYTMDVSAAGFKAYHQVGITLEVAHNVEQNVALQVGATSETVEVTANAAMVETKDNTIQQVLQNQSIDEMPLNGRNPTQLLGLAIGGTYTTPAGSDLTGSKNMGGSNASGTFSVAGSQANGINYLLDGGDNNDAFSNVNLPIPFPDAIQEFSVQTNGLPAQYGLHPGGIVNIVTKSGGNSFHGDMFDYLRNGDLNARQEGTLARDSLKRNQFGGTAGGRVIKDKVFFFAGYQGTRQRSNPANNIAYVATPATLTGDFSVVDGPKSAGGCLSTGKVLKSPSGTPYPNNQIPVSSFDPAGIKLASTYLPPAINSCGEAFFGYLTNNPDDQIIGRVDYVISEKQAFFARYYIYDYKALSVFNGTNALTTGTAGNTQRSQTMTIGDTYSFSGTAVDSFHATFDRRRNDRGDAPNLFSPKDLGVNMYDAIPNYMQLSVSGYSGSGFNIGCGTCAPGTFDVNTYQVADDFTLIRGKHQFGFGVDARKDQFNSVNNQQDNGQFTFNGGTTGDGLADLLVGRFSGLTDGNALSDYLRQTVFAAYAQDTFRATNRLTINIGIRWEPSVPSYDKYGRGNQFNWTLFNEGWHSSVYPNAPAGLIFSGDSQNHYGDALTASHYATFSPRFGLVWDPTGEGKQTIRASFSLMHDTTELFYPERWTTNPPYASSLTLSSGQFSNPFATYVSPSGVTGDPFPGSALFPVGGTYVSIPPDVPPTYVMQWNFNYQRQLGKDWLLSANYLGNATRHIWGSFDINPSIYGGSSSSTSNTSQRRLTYLANVAQGQFYGDIEQTDPGDNAEYHGLLVTGQHRVAHHFTINSNFTWSHCISEYDSSGELTSPVYQNPNNRAEGERGACSFDHRFIFNTSLVATSPGLGHGVAMVATKGWQFSTIGNLTSGQPLTLTDGGKDISLSAQLQDRPNVILPNAVIPATKTLGEWFNPAAFAVQPTGTFGDLGRFAIYGPGSIQFDVAMSRTFPVKERYRLDFRADFFNIMNHGNWSNPTTSIASSTFGSITSFGSPRIIQMALKLYF